VTEDDRTDYVAVSRHPDDVAVEGAPRRPPGFGVVVTVDPRPEGAMLKALAEAPQRHAPLVADLVVVAVPQDLELRPGELVELRRGPVPLRRVGTEPRAYVATIRFRSYMHDVGELTERVRLTIGTHRSFRVDDVVVDRDDGEDLALALDDVDRGC
jgi:hypothetical protein